MGIGMMAKWKGFTPTPELVRAAAEYLVMLSPYARLLQNCEVVVEQEDKDGRSRYRACVYLETATDAAGPVHAHSLDPHEALRHAFEAAKHTLDSIVGHGPHTGERTK